jgi:hypothetical protein
MNSRRVVSDMRPLPTQSDHQQPSVGLPRVQPATPWAGRSSDSDAHPTFAAPGLLSPRYAGEGECAAPSWNKLQAVNAGGPARCIRR